MRMSRKGRHRLEEAERLEEEGRKRWAPVAFRMSRKRRKRLAAAQDGAEPRLKRFVLQNMRMTRSRKRKMREEAAIRQSAQVASISALALLPPVTSEAAGISNAMNDIPAALDTLRNERNRIRDFHAAKRNVQEATAALKQAEQDLQRARQDRENAKKGLTEAQKNLENAQLNLQRIAQELANAQVESAQRTREAIAAQQAVADFAPQVWAQESAVQAAQARRQSIQASYEQLGQELGYLRDERDDLEERIRQAWESVGYAQNRLQDVIAMVNRTQAIVPEQSTKEEQWQAYDNQLAELDAAVDSAESLLDTLNSQLDALQEAREAAEDAERDARELVKDLQEQQVDGERDVKDSEQYAAEAEKWNEEAARGVETAEANLTTTQDWKTKADYDLEHFGEGKGFSTGFEYYNWHGAGQPNGHQLYQPIEFYATEKKWDFSLATGWLNSDTGLTDGHVSGWTDTTLGITYKNNHKINDVHYSLNINVPTGKENAHQKAMMADNLARFNSFSEGWQFTPGIEATHRFTERDSITGRLNYTFRGDYKYRRSYAESEIYNLQAYAEQISNISTRLKYIAYKGVDDAVFVQALQGTKTYAHYAQYNELLKEIADTNYPIRKYADMLNDLYAKAISHGENVKEAYESLFISAERQSESLKKWDVDTDKINAYKDMLGVLSNHGVTSWEKLNDYYFYAGLQYYYGKNKDKYSNVKSSSEPNLYDLVYDLVNFSKKDNNYQRFIATMKKIEPQKRALVEKWLSYSIFDNLIKHLISRGIDYDMVKNLFSSDSLLCFKDLIESSKNKSWSRDELKAELNKIPKWHEIIEHWDDDKIDIAIDELYDYGNLIVLASDYGLYDKIEDIEKEIKEAENQSTDLTTYSPATVAYLLSTKTITDIETQEEIDPGNKFQQELEYRHIGEANQLSVKFTHVNATHADYKSTLTSFTDDAGHVYGLNLPYGSGRNYDGEEWTLQVFNSQDIDRRNSLQYYVIGNYQAADAGGTHRYYGGLGWTHQFDKKQSAYALLNYGETHGQSYNWRTGKYDSGRVMKALVLGYDYRLNDVSELRAKLERYHINGSSSDSYHGWKMSLMWNKSF